MNDVYREGIAGWPIVLVPVIGGACAMVTGTPLWAVAILGTWGVTTLLMVIEGWRHGENPVVWAVAGVVAWPVAVVLWARRRRRYGLRPVEVSAALAVTWFLLAATGAAMRLLLFFC